MRSLLLAVSFLLLPITVFADDTVKVYLLAGQSNMEGKVQKVLMEHQATDAKTKSLFKHLRNDEGWITRDDVWIKYLGKHGGLTKGYGSGDRTGVELEFGWRMGDQLDDPVLLIKAAWGGHSLVKQFRPPSAGLPDEATLQEELKKAQERVTKRNAKRETDDPLPTMVDPLPRRAQAERQHRGIGARSGRRAVVGDHESTRARLS